MRSASKRRDGVRWLPSATDAQAETVTFTVGTAIPAGEATVTIAYRGILNDKLRGFYLSKANGRAYAVSQMEATDARRAFPGFDEPAHKATFDISITVPAGDTAISNGPVVADTPGPAPGTHTLRFATTPKMSTYLVALLVGDFVCREGSADDTPIRVCATPDKLGLTAFALEAAEFELAFFNRLLRHPVSLRQARHHRHSRFRRRGDGERRRHHVPRASAARRRGRRPRSACARPWRR